MSAELRKRRPGKTKTGRRTQTRDRKFSQNHCLNDEVSPSRLLFRNSVFFAIGLTLSLYMGYKHVIYMNTLHENRLWFSNIKEVEREISFRTESGLYYSYYKQMLKAPSINQGLYELTHDNMTENWRTINVLERMNIYQEVILSIMYRMFNIAKWLEPVYFYIDTVLFLHGMYVIALYCTSWMLSGSWLSGVLTAAFYIFNKEDTTRVEFTIPLRESFSLPFLFMQIAFITYYFRPQLSQLKQRIVCCFIGLCTLFFVLTWQFAQFVLLLQAMALFGCAVLDMVPLQKIKTIYIIHIISLMTVCTSQFFHPMILGSLVLSFIPAAFMVFHIKGKNSLPCGIMGRIFRIIFYIISVLGLMVAVNNIIKNIINIEADEHIFKFLSAKFGLLIPAISGTVRIFTLNFGLEKSLALKGLPGNVKHNIVRFLQVFDKLFKFLELPAFYFVRDFDANLYLCTGAFGFLPFDTFERLSSNGLFPLYLVVQTALLVILAIALVQNWKNESSLIDNCHAKDTLQVESKSTSHILSERPELVFHAIQTVFFGLMALSTMRFKYLWTPEMCILAGFAIGDSKTWKFLVKKFNITSELTCLPALYAELDELREFYDPDTVDLMEWIKNSTSKSAVFSGSMQLLAGVKLCTGRKLTNHPHYEDKQLREKTIQVQVLCFVPVSRTQYWLGPTTRKNPENPTLYYIQYKHIENMPGCAVVQNHYWPQ
uniref:Probable C-mannosyltransferase DPY19L3-like n=1 Tax=Saccoglossus kowalevskii TaxID=10224 RepID=A0ABM0MQT0_SACKO|nr:PREDICTED: probable C-mannosyltransferase DPY19L3-like [Saccoglossus kowalevskii]